jgi:hypothetical protein
MHSHGGQVLIGEVMPLAQTTPQAEYLKEIEARARAVFKEMAQGQA